LSRRQNKQMHKCKTTTQCACLPRTCLLTERQDKTRRDPKRTDRQCQRDISASDALSLCLPFITHPPRSNGDFCLRAALFPFPACLAVSHLQNIPSGFKADRRRSYQVNVYPHALDLLILSIWCHVFFRGENVVALEFSRGPQAVWS